jgi:hypothetical protein
MFEVLKQAVQQYSYCQDNDPPTHNAEEYFRENYERFEEYLSTP